MEYNQLPKGFFKKNPLNQLSSANIAYFSMTAGFDERLEKEIFDLAKETMDTERLDKINREREEISNLKKNRLNYSDSVLLANGIIMLCLRNHGCKKQQKIIYLFHALSDQTSNKQYISCIFP